MGGTFRDQGWEDREVTVRRDELLVALRANREKHVADYKAACEGYRQTAMEKIESVFLELKDRINALKAGQAIANVGISFSLPAPVSHEKAYDQIIRMMEMSVGDEIALTAGQFACFVMDDWDWKNQWSASNVGYMEKAGAAFGGSRR